MYRKVLEIWLSQVTYQERCTGSIRVWLSPLSAEVSSSVIMGTIYTLELALIAGSA